MKQSKWIIALLLLLVLVEPFIISLVNKSKKQIEKPLINYIEVSKAKTEPLRDSIKVYKVLVDSLKKAKRGIKIVPYSVLVKDTVYLDSACNIVANRLLNQIAKRDSIHKIDSSIITRQDKEIQVHQKIDSVNTFIIKDCQSDRDSIKTESDKRILKAENKVIKVGLIGAILLIFAWLL
jgi:hypothetical protein